MPLRIDRTRNFFAPVVSEDLSQDKFRKHLDLVNWMHTMTGVVSDQPGAPVVTDYYRAGFTFVITSLKEMMRQFFEREMKDADMPKIDQALHDIWYGAGAAVGADTKPADGEADREFYEAYKARITKQINGDPKTRNIAKLLAIAFLPGIAENCRCSEQEFVQLVQQIEPDLFDALDLGTSDLPAEFVESLGTSKKHEQQAYREFHRKHQGKWLKQRPKMPDFSATIAGGVLAIGKHVSGKVAALFRGKKKPDGREVTLDTMWQGVDPEGRNREKPEPAGNMIGALAKKFGEAVLGKVVERKKDNKPARPRKAHPVAAEAGVNQPKLRDAFSRTLFHIMNLDPALTKKLGLTLTTRTLAPGETLIRQGGDPGKIFVVYGVTQGKLCVVRRGHDGTESGIPGADIGTADGAKTLGEISMYRRMKHREESPQATATVRAELSEQPTVVQMVEVSPEQYKALTHEDSRYRRWVTQSIAMTVHERLSSNANADFVGLMSKLLEAMRDGSAAESVDDVIGRLEASAGSEEGEQVQLAAVIRDLRLYKDLTAETSKYRTREVENGSKA